MTLKQVQKLEIIWVVLGIIFNTLSYWQVHIGQPALSATDPLGGNIFMTICGIVVLAGLKGAKNAYKFTIPLLTISLIYSGWFLHIQAYFTDNTLPDYASFTSWLAVIIINTYGVITMALGSWLGFRKK